MSKSCTIIYVTVSLMVYFLLSINFGLHKNCSCFAMDIWIHLLQTVLCLQFILHNVTEPRPIDPDMPVIPPPTDVPKHKISLVPFISALRKLRYNHIRLLFVWGIVLCHEDIVSLVCSFHQISYCILKHVVQCRALFCRMVQILLLIFVFLHCIFISVCQLQCVDWFY